MKTSVGNQAPQFGMISKFLPSLFKRILDFEDEQRMPPGGATAVKDDATGVVRRKPAGGIAPGSHRAGERGATAIAKTSRPRGQVTTKAADQVKHGTPP
jgi:hypothetical protein